MPALQVSSGKYESYAHKLLWESSRRHLSLSEANPEDSWLLHLSAGLLAAAAFEAYLNYVGEEVLPHIWDQERTFFAQAPYKGTFGKLKRIAEEIRWELPRRDLQPIAGAVELHALRDKVVHGRTLRVNWKRTHPANQLPRTPGGWLSAEAPPTKVRRLIVKTEELAILLHGHLLASEFQYCILGSHPLIGMLGFGSLSARAA